MSGNFYSKYPVSGSGSGTVTSVAMTVPSLLSISGSPVTTSGTLALTYSGTALPIANGGTGQTSAANAINALLPDQTSNSGKFLSTNGSIASWQTAGGSSILDNNTFLQSNNAANDNFVDLIKANNGDEIQIGTAATNQGMKFFATSAMTFTVLGGPNVIDFAANIVEIDSDGTVAASLRLLTQDENAYIILQAPATGSSDKTFVFPNDYGSNGDVLSTDGFGILSWQPVGGAGANTTLSNLGSTAINAYLVFDAGFTAVVQTKDASATTETIEIRSGAATGFNSGGASLISGTSNSALTGDVNLQTGNNTGTGDTGYLILVTGDVSDGDSGQVNINTGRATGTGFSGDLFISSGNVDSNGSSKAGDIYLATGGGTGGNGDTFGRVILQTTLQTQTIGGSITTTTNANAGSGASSSVSVASETAGAVSLTTGAGSSAGAQLTVNFTTPFPSAPRCVLTPTNSTAANLLGTFAGVYVTTTTSALTINFVGAPAPATFTWDYFCIEVV